MQKKIILSYLENLNIQIVMHNNFNFYYETEIFNINITHTYFAFNKADLEKVVYIEKL